VSGRSHSERPCRPVPSSSSSSVTLSRSVNARERLLVRLLRLCGSVLLLAAVAVFLPTRWMEASSRWLGLGEFPASPLVDYLTRSISAMYAMHGAVLIGVAQDVRRFAPLVVLLAWASVAFGATMLGIDLHAGMPGYWTLAEGPSILLMGVLYLWLARGLQSEGGPGAGATSG